MFYRLFSFLKFLIASSNQHGVHSPFVYQYVTKCLYAAPNFRNSKSQNILLKTIAYFKIVHVQLSTHNSSLAKEITENLAGVTITDSSSELIFIDKLDNDTIDQFIVNNANITNDTIVYLDKIHKTKGIDNLWGDIKELEQVRVTIDLFYGGLVFFRGEQVKEHFKIRI
jgi:hypothetical protein